MRAYIFFTACIAITVVALTGTVEAKPDASNRKSLKVSGKIKIVSAKGREILSATLTTGEGETYEIVIDQAGRDVARVMFGNRVDVVGSVSRRDGKRWLKITSLQRADDTEAFELWRRSRCNGCVVKGAAQNARRPKNLHGAKAIAGRYYTLKQQFVAMARSDKHLWLATDNQIFQVDLAKQRLLRTFDRTDGLPEGGVYDLATDGKTVWIVCHGALGVLTISDGKIARLPDVRPNVARTVVCDTGAWIVADTCTLRMTGGPDTMKKLPALPTGKRISATADRGLWAADWSKATSYFLTSPVSLGERLYVASLGRAYELAGGEWKEIAESAWAMCKHGDKLWMLTPEGVKSYDPKTHRVQTHAPPTLKEGRLTRLLMTRNSAWVTAEPRTLPKDKGFVGGGIARLDLTSHEWRAIKQIGGRDTTQASVFAGEDGAVWAVTRVGEYRSQAAHPGMTYVKKKRFVSGSITLHRRGGDGKWTTIPLPMRNLERRFICGQDGGGGYDHIVPRAVTNLCVGPKTVFANMRLFPEKYFSGYWPCLQRVAVRDSKADPWKESFEHRPEGLGLQGEQPRVLNISNLGQMVLNAIGHDDVLDTFVHDGTCWAVTQGRASWYDDAARQWRTIAKSQFRFYWRATAALDDGRGLYLGSDRGLVSRLDFTTGRFEILGGLKDRQITRIVREPGKILVASDPPPLGAMPVQLRKLPNLLEAEAAVFDGKTWTKADPSSVPVAKASSWAIKPPPGYKQRRQAFVRDTRFGNFLWGPGSDGTPAPRYYVKGVFAPQFLCLGDGGKRIWLSTFTGLIGVSLDAEESSK
jgi:hypothetical protein